MTLAVAAMPEEFPVAFTFFLGVGVYRLVRRDENVKVTLSLSRRSVEFFKREAGKAGVPYQRMIRALVDAYAVRRGRTER